MIAGRWSLQHVCFETSIRCCNAPKPTGCNSWLTWNSTIHSELSKHGSHARSQIHPRKCRTSSRTAAIAAPRPTSIASSSWKTERKTLKTEIEEQNRQANEVSQVDRQGQGRGRARGAQGGRAAASASRPPGSKRARRHRARGRRDPSLDPQPVASRRPRSAPTTRPICEVARGKTPLPTFDFKPLDHVELAERLDLVDFEGGARVAGHGFYFLKNEAVLLELALQRYALGLLLAEGFTPDDHARPGPQRGPGRDRLHPARAGNADLQRRADRPEPRGHRRDHAGRPAGRPDASMPSDLPIKLCGISHCFRTEAGAHGRATRGLYPRAPVHQDRDVRLHAPRSERRHAGTTSAAWSAGCSMAWAFRTTWSIRPPATWAGRPIASTIWRPGCRAAASLAR